MSNISLGNNIPRSLIVGERLLDGNANATVGTNGTATNITWGTDGIRGYQKGYGIFNGTNAQISSTYPGYPTGNSPFTYNIWINTDTLSGYRTPFRVGGTSGTGLLFSTDGANNDGTLTFGRYGNTILDTSFAMVVGTWYMITCIHDGTTFTAYANGVLIGTVNVTFNISATTMYIGSINLGQYWDGKINLFRIYNTAISQAEIQTLYLEGLRKLGPSNIASYPSLLSGLVGYFDNPIYGTNELWNIATGVKSTRIAGKNTTDNLGIDKAITNPNYTWSSITYTTGYSFENSGGGWLIETNPTGLSATGINRTTTLRNIFLFNRTLSSDEVTMLQSLCNADYPVPTKSYDLSGLRDGLLLDLNEQGKDLSGNGNDGTLVNTPTVIRVGKAKGLTYNGTNQYITRTQTISGLDLTFGAWIKITSGAGGHIIALSSPTATQPRIDMSFFNGGTGSIYLYGYSQSGALVREFRTPAISYGVWYYVNMVRSSNTSVEKLYINGVEQTLTYIQTGAVTSITTTTITTGAIRLSSPVSFFNGTIIKPKIRNRMLTATEIQQLYYSQKGNFIY